MKNILKKFAIIAVCTAIFIALFFVARKNYLLYHSIIEFFAIFTGLSISLVSFATRGFNQNRIFMKFGIVYLFVPIVDFLHTLAYKGMDVFRNWTANQPTQFWIVGRSLEVLGFFLILFFPKITERVLFFLFSSLTTLLISAVWLGFFPDCFIEGSGLTVFKIAMEYVIVSVLLLVLIKCIKSRDASISAFRRSIVLAIIFTILGELSFTLYVDVYGFFNFLGHVFRFVSYLVILNGVIVNSLKDPIQSLLIELNREKEHLEKVARRDTLTDLFNRAYFNEWIQRQVDHASLCKVPLSFIMIDVDDFKKINDSFGHLTGDKVLRTVARCIASSIRSSDFPARYGGDEFIVVLHDVSEKQAEQIAQRIREKVVASKELGLNVDISYGVAELEPGVDYLKALHKADEAMYRMKKSKTAFPEIQTEKP
ncbi:diguanylate cyclase [Thermotoga sp. Ku-13t]|uniref:sensor domain-containing diguanylate cyclase n=1 Tax=Thermotoga sp. Ku-13t TaxID=1755813 RepID=UPI0016AB8568|nr:GGDEF domain-containing protein [Thermotoga sp. Ku-13t]KAF2957949.1 diguanylate cyclase [Thermotoga sp. Ku-13t]